MVLRHQRRQPPRKATSIAQDMPSILGKSQPATSDGQQPRHPRTHLTPALVVAHAASSCSRSAAAPPPLPPPGGVPPHCNGVTATLQSAPPQPTPQPKNGCLIEAPWLVHGRHGASLRQPLGSPAVRPAPARAAAAHHPAGRGRRCAAIVRLQRLVVALAAALSRGAQAGRQPTAAAYWQAVRAMPQARRPNARAGSHDSPPPPAAAAAAHASVSAVHTPRALHAPRTPGPLP
jgi:hypothetical protein